MGNWRERGDEMITMRWRERGDEMITMRCRDASHPEGGCATAMTARSAAEQMISLDDSLKAAGREPKFYGFGEHVTDPVALVRRFLHLRGYQLVPDKIDRMVCPKHKKK